MALPMIDDRASHSRQAKAVALKTDEERPELPRVTALAKGALAERIVSIALEHGVKVREDADLTEILAAIDLDCPIPVEAISAVADILAYVYAANRTPPPEHPLP